MRRYMGQEPNNASSNAVVRLQVAELMKKRGITAYRLSREAGLAYPTAYRLSQPPGVFGRLEVDTLNRLCEFFRVQPGELIEWVPDGQPTTEDYAGQPTAQRTGLPGHPTGHP